MRLSVLHVLRPAAGGMRRHVDLLLPRLAAAGWDVAAAGPIDRAWAERLGSAGVRVYPCPLWSMAASLAAIATGEGVARPGPGCVPGRPAPWRSRSVRGPVPAAAAAPPAGAASPAGSVGPGPGSWRPSHAPAGRRPRALVRCTGGPPDGAAGRRPLPWRGASDQAARLLDPVPSRPDIVHAHGYLAAFWASALPGRHIATAHNLPRRSLGNPRARWLAVSHAVAAALAARGVPEGRLHVIPGACLPCEPVDRERCRRALGLALPPGRPAIGFVGRLVAGKGLDTLLAALDRLPQAILLVAGEGPRRPRDDSRVVLLGRVPDPVLVYGAADVVCVPSRAEGFGLTALEALAAGRPVVASATGGLPEIVHHGSTGLLVPPGDAGALAMALGALLASPGTRWRMGQAGRAAAAALTAEAQAAAVLDAYAAAGRERV